jgi:hypothetical protein
MGTVNQEGSRNNISKYNELRKSPATNLYRLFRPGEYELVEKVGSE